MKTAICGSLSTERSLELYSEVHRISYRSSLPRTGAVLWVTPQERGHQTGQAIALCLSLPFYIRGGVLQESASRTPFQLDQFTKHQVKVR